MIRPDDSRDSAESRHGDATRSEAHRPTAEAPLPGEIAGYRIVRKLGEGGMGLVYEAEQSAPVRRRVALKVIKPGMDSGQVMARFEAERQALALMDHPAIAHVYDAGSTPEGRPFFAMELVSGVPITDYCDKNRLNTAERLALFTRVCEGVQHAHQKAVIHRDLKPSNILVSDADGKPVPKIIDFGVAKATTQKLSEKTMYTAFGQVIGTPAYMSPEQAEMSGLDVDTRTDVYALGVLLYELLTGTLPFQATTLKEAGLDEIRRIIREEEPPRPSTRVRTLGEHAPTIAAKRRTDPGHWRRSLQHELDWIILKALEKDRNRRYATVSALAADNGRYLADEPVEAGPPSAVYRARKYLKRHRIGVGFAGLVVLAVAVGFVLMSVQNARIAAARDEAELVTSTLEDMLASVDPTKSGRDVTVKELLDETAKTLGEQFHDQPLIEARLRHTVGWTYLQLGEYDVAADQLERAARIQRERLGMENPATISTVSDLARLYALMGRNAEAEPLAGEALDASRRILGEENPQTLRTLRTFAISRGQQGHLEEAETLYRECWEMGRRVLGPDHPETRGAMGSLAVVATKLGHYDEAAPLFEENLEYSRRSYGEDDPRTLQPMANLANLYEKQGRLEEAETLTRQCLEGRRRVLGDEHPSTMGSMHKLAHLCQLQGRFEDAEALWRETLALRRRVLGDDDPTTLLSIGQLAYVCRERGLLDESEALFREQLERRRRVLGEEHKDTLDSRFQLAWTLLRQGKLDEAEALNRDTLAVSRRVLGENSGQSNILRYNLACTLALQGRRGEALTALRDALDHGFGSIDNWYELGRAIRDDPDLDSLHGNPEFEAIVAELVEGA